MKSLWLQREGRDALIVVFGGWALGPAPFAHLHGTQDVLFMDDYRRLDTPIEEIKAYSRCYLVAFSFGVAAAARWMSLYGDVFHRKVAINGTLYPTDARRGIPAARVRATARRLSPENLSRFVERCGAPPLQMSADIERLREELLGVCAWSSDASASFDTVWLSLDDRIFPPANMECAWQESAVTPIHIHGPHAPFSRWREWEELLA